MNSRLGQVSKEVPCARSASHTREQLRNGPFGREIVGRSCLRTVSPISCSHLRKLTGLPKDQHALLLAKQQKLRALDALASAESSALTNAADATWIFAPDSAGRAVCMASSGLVLTCSHRISEDPEESETPLIDILFRTNCTEELHRLRDLTLLQIIAAQPPVPERLALIRSQPPPCEPIFPAIARSSTPPKPRLLLAFVDHPGSDHFESPPRWHNTLPRPVHQQGKTPRCSERARRTEPLRDRRIAA